IYFVNGVHKATGADWLNGSIMHYVSANLGWSRISFAQFPLPYPVAQALTWIVLFWELAFPLLVMMRPFRALTLWVGAFFHIGTGVLLQIGAFPLYMLCLYLPLIPWERFVDAFSGQRVEQITDLRTQRAIAERLPPGRRPVVAARS